MGYFTYGGQKYCTNIAQKDVMVEKLQPILKWQI